MSFGRGMRPTSCKRLADFHPRVVKCNKMRVRPIGECRSPAKASKYRQNNGVHRQSYFRQSSNQIFFQKNDRFHRQNLPNTGKHPPFTGKCVFHRDFFPLAIFCTEEPLGGSRGLNLAGFMISKFREPPGERISKVSGPQALQLRL